MQLRLSNSKMYNDTEEKGGGLIDCHTVHAGSGSHQQHAHQSFSEAGRHLGRSSITLGETGNVLCILLLVEQQKGYGMASRSREQGQQICRKLSTT